MPQVINTNIFALNAQRNLNKTTSALQTSMERLSSGLRINRAKDDAAGLAISDKMTAQIRGLNQAIRNVNDGVGYVQTADGALEEVTNSLQRMRELAVQASTGTVSSTAGAGGGTSDKGKLNAEFQALALSIGDILADTKFNGVTVFGASVDIQSGTESGDSITVSVGSLSLSGLAADISSASGAQGALATLDGDLNVVATARADAGASQSRLESTARNLANVVENVSAARSQILDADFAMETANLTRAQILQQSGAAILAQANV
ncbi:MAG: flagellin, partial [Sedimenticolaceae bacterium]